MMTGYGGTGKSGRRYNYYACKDMVKKKGDKKIVSKSAIEDKVVDACVTLLEEESIKLISKRVSEACNNTEESYTIKHLKAEIKKVEKTIENLMTALESGQVVELISERLNMRIAEKKNLEKELATEVNKNFILTESEIECFLIYVKGLPHNDIEKRRALINIFVNSIYLYDDRMTIVFNVANKKTLQKDIPIDEIEKNLDNKTATGKCSCLIKSAAPFRVFITQVNTRFSFCQAMIHIYFCLCNRAGF